MQMNTDASFAKSAFETSHVRLVADFSCALAWRPPQNLEPIATPNHPSTRHPRPPDPHCVSYLINFLAFVLRKSGGIPQDGVISWTPSTITLEHVRQRSLTDSTALLCSSMSKALGSNLARTSTTRLRTP
ncbi:hypothetical protein B0H10DRAFT_2029036 [Mycena sp. CBHHK59/15]|nr:hypothetical protein B0H10DRAFT_2029036 [Mycena sp. CBHHK59/15]